MDGFSKFLKTLCKIPLIGFVLALAILAFVAPLAVTFFTVRAYDSDLSKSAKCAAWVISFIAELFFIAACITKTAQPLFLIPTLVSWLFCAVLGFCGNARRRRKRRNP